MKKMCVNDDLRIRINKISTINDLKLVVKNLQILSYNNRGKREVLNLVRDAIKKSLSLECKICLINLYSLEITHLQHYRKNLVIITNIAEKIYSLSKRVHYTDGLALYNAHRWFIEKSKGNKNQATLAIEESISILNKFPTSDNFIFYVCNYIFAIEKWLVNRDFVSAKILEKCFTYFYSNGYYHGSAMSSGVLTIIYQQTQNQEKLMNLTKFILNNSNFLARTTEEIKAMIHYFIGVGQKLSFNLDIAEKHLSETNQILKNIHNTSLYSEYYVTTLSHLSEIYALQGRLGLAIEKIKIIEELLAENKVLENVDSFNKKQIEHTFRLTKFYVRSRLSGFQSENNQKLIKNILLHVEGYYSNAILLSDFLLNAKLKQNQLIELKNLENHSTIRVEHIINFLIKKNSEGEKIQLYDQIQLLRKRPAEDRMTLSEKAYADLLAAQEFYKIERFAEITSLLKQYEKRLHRIEVLEMRIFMEAFIQVGAYKNGDPLGPALQYMAIKKCRQHGFSRLESKLLDYLQLQQKEIGGTL